MNSIKIKTTLDPKKLKTFLPKMILDVVKDVAETVKDETTENLDKGRDVRGQAFAPIKESTREVRRLRGHSGDKPLVASGEMKDSVKARQTKKGYVVFAESYGNRSTPDVHHQGFMTKNNPTIKGKQFFFKGKRIPSRPWFFNESNIESSKRLNMQFQEIYKEFFENFNIKLTK